MEIRFKDAMLHTMGEPIQVGSKAPAFTVVKSDLSALTLSSPEVEGKVKIISCAPSLDTSVCQVQTRRFNELATQNKQICVISMSMDLPFAADRFCSVEGISGVVAASDYAEREFGSKYGLLIQENKLLARAVVVLDKQNVVQYVEVTPELTQEPNYDAALAKALSL